MRFPETVTRGVLPRKASYVIAALVLLFVMATEGMTLANAHSAPSIHRLQGTVESGGNGLDGYSVTLYVSYAGRKPYWRALGTATTDSAGEFSIPLKRRRVGAILFVVAEKDSAMLVSVIGRGLRIPRYVVVNELTTVATGAAFAQFIDGEKIRGNKYGMLNAVKIAEDMAIPETGELGEVLANSPNGSDSSTLKTFNTLANIVAGCIADVEGGGDCNALLSTAEAPDGTPAETVLDAVANMTKNPSNAVGTLFGLASDVVYAPALTEAPVSWLLFIKFTGGFYSDYASTNLMNGPGQVAIDKRGYFWINDNYVPANPLPVVFGLPDFLGNPPAFLPDYIACAGKRLLKFYPWGEPYAGMPITTGYTGGGLSGAGFGITLDPHGNVWVGNFGFEAPICSYFPAIAAPHDSVSLFRRNGKPISGPNGFTQGQIWWPQATMSDRKGNIWIANCGNDTVTLIPRGNPLRARNIALPGGLGEEGYYKPVYKKSDPNTQPNLKPFALTIDPEGRAWVTGNLAPGDPDAGIGAVYRISPDGTLENISNTPTEGTGPLFSRPMGIVGDRKGNIWVSNSDAVNVPCVDPFERHAGGNPSVAFISADGSTREVHTGGGLTIPWGSAIDGADQLWVFNFNEHLETDGDSFEYPPTALSRFCGTGKCPAGKILGDSISPDASMTSPGGYTTDMLDRVTGGAIGPSGAIVILNNWQKPGPRPIYYHTSPGGNSFVIVPGAAAPIKTPLIGPPRSFGEP